MITDYQKFIEELMEEGGFYWNPFLPYSIKPNSGLEEDTSSQKECYIEDSMEGLMIDCRIPVEARKDMALGITPVLGYAEYKGEGNV